MTAVDATPAGVPAQPRGGWRPDVLLPADREVQHRTLPKKYMAMIRTGVHPQVLRERGKPALMDALVTTAMSAVNRNWTYFEWREHVLRPDHHLGVQVRMRKGRLVKPKDLDSMMRRAWDRARERVQECPAPTADPKVWARARVGVWHDAALACPSISPNHRALLLAIASIAHEIGTVQPTAPKLRLMAVSGLKETATRNAVTRLIEMGWLYVQERGRPGPRSGQATIYRITLPVGHHTEGFERLSGYACICAKGTRTAVPLAAREASLRRRGNVEQDLRETLVAAGREDLLARLFAPRVAHEPPDTSALSRPWSTY